MTSRPQFNVQAVKNVSSQVMFVIQICISDIEQVKELKVISILKTLTLNKHNKIKSTDTGLSQFLSLPSHTRNLFCFF